MAKILRFPTRCRLVITRTAAGYVAAVPTGAGGVHVEAVEAEPFVRRLFGLLLAEDDRIEALCAAAPDIEAAERVLRSQVLTADRLIDRLACLRDDAIDAAIEVVVREYDARIAARLPEDDPRRAWLLGQRPA